MSSRKISCPRCGKPSLFTSENPCRPFCSERCKLIDLGNWADGRYAIPVGGASAAGSEETCDEERDEKMSTIHEEHEENVGDSGTESGFDDNDHHHH